MGSAMYANTDAGATTGAAGDAGATSSDDDVVDAEIVDEGEGEQA